MLIPVQENIKKGPPPIRVKYIENKKPIDLNPGKIVDAPDTPVKKEIPKRELPKGGKQTSKRGKHFQKGKQTSKRGKH